MMEHIFASNNLSLYLCRDNRIQQNMLKPQRHMTMSHTHIQYNLL